MSRSRNTDMDGTRIELLRGMDSVVTKFCSQQLEKRDQFMELCDLQQHNKKRGAQLETSKANDCLFT